MIKVANRIEKFLIVKFVIYGVMEYHKSSCNESRR